MFFSPILPVFEVSADEKPKREKFRRKKKSFSKPRSEIVETNGAARGRRQKEKKKKNYSRYDERWKFLVRVHARPSASLSTATAGGHAKSSNFWSFRPSERQTLLLSLFFLLFSAP